MKHNAKILTGQKFGKLSVLSHAGTNSQRQVIWLFEIDGDNKTASQWSVVSGTPTQTIEWRYRKGWSSNEAVYGRTA